MSGDASYEGVEGLLTKVIAGRFGSGLGTFFFGFFTSRLRASLFPMPHRMPQFYAFATALGGGESILFGLASHTLTRY
ncbi:MAG: hypothetical protein ABSB66_09345 [Candidatus Acidiferrales bacterium]|jgi:hypothetical protein